MNRDVLLAALEKVRAMSLHSEVRDAFSWSDLATALAPLLPDVTPPPHAVTRLESAERAAVDILAKGGYTHEVQRLRHHIGVALKAIHQEKTPLAWFSPALTHAMQELEGAYEERRVVQDWSRLDEFGALIRRLRAEQEVFADHQTPDHPLGRACGARVSRWSCGFHDNGDRTESIDHMNAPHDYVVVCDLPAGHGGACEGELGRWRWAR